MPIYEYRCEECGRIYNMLILRREETSRIRCPHCGGQKATKLFSPFAYHKSEASRLEEFDTSKPRGEEFYKDTRNIGLWAKKRAKEMGVDLGPKFDEVVEKARSGKLEDLSKDM